MAKGKSKDLTLNALNARSKDCPDFRITLRIHYDATTAYLLEPLLQDVITYLNRREFFSIHFHQIERLGGVSDADIALPSDEDHAHVRRLMEKFTKISRRSANHTMVVDVTDYICYAARANSLVVRADGRLSKCTVALSDERNIIGKLNPDGTVEISNERLRPWLRGLFLGDSKVLACPWAGISVADQ